MTKSICEVEGCGNYVVSHGLCDKHRQRLVKHGHINPTTKTPRYLAVDHCHNTKQVRGLLCTKCNTAIGALQDSIELLRKAVLYLERKPQP